MEIVSRHYFKFLLWLGIALGFSLNCIAGRYLTVTSTDDGHGLYSYTFSRGDEPYIWGFSNTNEVILMKSYGIIETLQPPGWTSTVDSSGMITWCYTNG